MILGILIETESDQEAGEAPGRRGRKDRPGQRPQQGGPQGTVSAGFTQSRAEGPPHGQPVALTWRARSSYNTGQYRLLHPFRNRELPLKLALRTHRLLVHNSPHRLAGRLGIRARP